MRAMRWVAISAVVITMLWVGSRSRDDSLSPTVAGPGPGEPGLPLHVPAGTPASQDVERELVPVKEADAGPGNSGVRSPLEEVLAMQMQEAPEEVQKTYLAVAQLEERNFARQRDAAAAVSGDSLDKYLEYLILCRDVRMRQLVCGELLNRSGVLVFEGLDDASHRKRLEEDGADRPSMRYAGVATFYGRQADLLVYIGKQGESMDGEMAALCDSLHEVAMSCLESAVARFNQMTPENRSANMGAYKKTGVMPGFSRDMMYIVGGNLRTTLEGDWLRIEY